MTANRDKSVFIMDLGIEETKNRGKYNIAQFPHSKTKPNQQENQFFDELPYSGDSGMWDKSNYPFICPDLGCQITPE